jgi:predicted enzyme related to lactoylglutathione lyase
MGAIRLEHVGIKAQGDAFAAAVRFYTEALGWEQVVELWEPFHLAFLADGQGGILELMDLDGPPLQGPSHLSFAVPMSEFEATIARVEAAGVTFDAPMQLPTGDIIRYFTDPAGNRAQVIGRVRSVGAATD